MLAGMARSDRAVGRAPARMLLFFVLLGVVLMHTLGHADHGDGATAASMSGMAAESTLPGYRL
jgi:hypothetical protein